MKQVHNSDAADYNGRELEKGYKAPKFIDPVPLEKLIKEKSRSYDKGTIVDEDPEDVQE